MTRSWADARRFIQEDLWTTELEPRTWAARALALLQFGVMIGQGFVRDRLLLRASSLAYFTVLSMIPLLAVAIAIVGSVGVRTDLDERVVEQIAAGSPEAQQKILELIQAANFAGLGTIGVVTLLVVTVLGIGNVERALNGIWGVHRQRSMSRRFSDYLAVLVVAPLLLGSALSLATTLKSQWLVQRLVALPGFATLYDFGLQHAPTLFVAVAFTFLYWFLPNTRVRPVAAAIGGLVAALLVVAAQNLYLGFSIGVARANALFGGFAALPLLFVWIYVFWAAVLLGAEVAFGWQNLSLYRREVRGLEAGPAQREAIGLRIAVEVARAFRDRRAPWTEGGLSDALHCPVRTVRDIVVPLRAGGILSAIAGADKEEGLQLGRPAEDIAVVDVLAALRGAREPLRGDRLVSGVVEALLDELDEGEAKAAAGQSLADLVARRSPGPAATGDA